ncbi:cell shape determination protein CcmA [Ectothiorhodospira shaposhnikovii]|uniref:bactofilin family protein n=1 Tax=Ectothiorhodospira shaposhnikovii TaxID=1054 RepID=UPI001907CC6D|nr:polymer-forming cytoskeletal protein [Ectothiorhodospira shaposhnikovii]MBK1673389.1 cell shape determination protein CcmA [Ectothiorhodospira shaposhnikovii]
MWSRRKKLKPARVDTVVGRNTVITGDVRFSGGLHLEGTVRGNLLAEDTSQDSILVLNQGALVEGDVRVPRVIINGAVEGDVYASVHVELAPHARIRGNLNYTLMEMAVGAEVNGSLVRQSEDPLRLEHLDVPTDKGRSDPERKKGLRQSGPGPEAALPESTTKDS